MKTQTRSKIIVQLGLTVGILGLACLALAAQEEPPEEPPPDAIALFGDRCISNSSVVGCPSTTECPTWGCYCSGSQSDKTTRFMHYCQTRWYLSTTCNYSCCGDCGVQLNCDGTNGAAGNCSDQHDTCTTT